MLFQPGCGEPDVPPLRFVSNSSSVHFFDRSGEMAQSSEMHLAISRLAVPHDGTSRRTCGGRQRGGVRSWERETRVYGPASAQILRSRPRRLRRCSTVRQARCACCEVAAASARPVTCPKCARAVPCPARRDAEEPTLRRTLHGMLKAPAARRTSPGRMIVFGSLCANVKNGKNCRRAGIADVTHGAFRLPPGRRKARYCGNAIRAGGSAPLSRAVSRQAGWNRPLCRSPCAQAVWQVFGIPRRRSPGSPALARRLPVLQCGYSASLLLSAGSASAACSLPATIASSSDLSLSSISGLKPTCTFCTTPALSISTKVGMPSTP